MRQINELTRALRKRLLNSSELANLPIRTRSKRAKQLVCEALNLPIPKSFAKTSPRLVAENLDVAVQKANNFQPWNTEIDPNRRYAFLILDRKDRVRDVKVLMGTEVIKYNTSPTLTSKYQAAFVNYDEPGVRVHGADTALVQGLLKAPPSGLLASDPCAGPDAGLLPLHEVAQRLSSLIGTTIVDPGADQERLRGQGLHEHVGRALGYTGHRDTGQHPDVPNQILEIKLQTSPTVDLGLVDPTSEGRLSPPFPDSLRHADTRYAVFGAAQASKALVRIVGITLVSGERFFEVFRRFGGLGVNSKLQIRLPTAWWL